MCGPKNAAGAPLKKALCQSDPDIRQIYAELAEHWRALAEQIEFLQQYQ
jgi:hypothetical protein